MKGRIMMAIEKKTYESPDMELLTLTTPEELASLSVDDNSDEPQAYAQTDSGVWTPWV